MMREAWLRVVERRSVKGRAMADGGGAPGVGGRPDRRRAQLPADRDRSGPTQVVRLVTNIVLARLLTPSDFGIVAVAIVATSLLDQLKDVGTASAIIQRKEVDQVLLEHGLLPQRRDGALAAYWLILLGPVASALGNPMPPRSSGCSGAHVRRRRWVKCTRACCAAACGSGVAVITSCRPS